MLRTLPAAAPKMNGLPLASSQVTERDLEERLLTLESKGYETTTLEVDVLSQTIAEIRETLLEVRNLPTLVGLEKKNQDLFNTIDDILLRLIQPALHFYQGYKNQQADKSQKVDAALLTLLDEMKFLIRVSGECQQQKIQSQLQFIQEYYNKAHQAWLAADENQRVQMRMPKAQLSTQEGKFFYLNQETARAMLCRAPDGSPIKENSAGIHKVSRLKSRNVYIFFKMNSNRLIIGPGRECQSDVFDNTLLARGLNAPTTLFKLSHVLLTVPRENNKVIPDEIKEMQQNIPGVSADTLLVERVGQAGYGIVGMDFFELLDLIHSFNMLVRAVGKEELINNWAFLTANIATKNAAAESLPKETIMQMYCDLFKNTTHKLPLDCQEFNNHFFSALYANYSTNVLIYAYNILTQWPQLMADNYLVQIIRIPLLFKYLAEFFPNNTPEEIITQSPNLLDKLDNENFTGHFLTNLLKKPADNKPDNYIAVIEKDGSGCVAKISLVAIDNDELADHATVTLRTKNAPALHVPGMKSVIFCLPKMLGPLAPNTRNLFLRHSANPEQFIFEWLTSLLQKNSKYEWLIKMGVITDKDRFDEDKITPALDIPLRFKPSLIPRLSQELKLALELVKQNPVITQQKLFEAVEPILAKYYQIMVAKNSYLMQKIQAIYDELVKTPQLLTTELLLQNIEDTLFAYFTDHTDHPALGEIQRLFESVTSDASTLTPQQLYVAIEKILITECSTTVSHTNEQPLEVVRRLYKKTPTIEEVLGDDLETEIIDSRDNVKKVKRQLLPTTNAHNEKPQTLQDTIQQFVNMQDIFKKSPGSESAWTLLNYIANNYPFINKLPLEQAQLNSYLQKAVIQDNDKVAELLLRSGADTGVNENSKPPLHLAITLSTLSPKVIAVIIKLSKKHNIIDAFNGQTLPPIFLATTNKNIAAINCLIDHGANLELRVQGQTVLEYATNLSNPEAFLALAMRGAGLSANPEKTLEFINKYKRDPKWLKPMQDALEILRKQNSMVGWLDAIDTLMQPVSGTVDSAKELPYFTEGIITPPRLLKEEVYAELFDANGAPKKPNRRGTHPVPFAEINGRRLYFKFYPNKPLKDLAGLVAAELLFDMPVTIPADLFVIKNKQGKVFPVLVTLSSGEDDLQKVLNDPEKRSQLENKLDHRHFSMEFILNILLNYSDGKPDNVFLDKFINAQGMARYRTRFVDNDHAFDPPVKKDPETGHTKIVNKTMTYFYKENEWPLHDDVRQKFLLKIPEEDLLKNPEEVLLKKRAEVLTAWFNRLKHYEQRCVQLFSKKDREDFLDENKVELCLSLPRGAAGDIFRKYCILQDKLQVQPSITALELLRKAIPIIGVLVRSTFKKHDNVSQRYLELHGENNIFVTALLEGENNTVSLDTRKQILTTAAIQDPKGANGIPVVTRSIDDTLTELRIIVSEDGTINEVRDKLLAGNDASFNALYQDSSRQKVLDSIFDGKSGIKDKKLLQKIFNAIKGKAIVKLNLAGIAVVDDSILEDVLKHLPYLTELNLTGCKVTAKIMPIIARNCFVLKKLTLANLNITSLSDGKNPVQFLHLRRLWIHELPLLESIRLVAPNLLTLGLRGFNKDKIKELDIATTTLTGLTYEMCPLSLTPQIERLVYQSPELLNNIEKVSPHPGVMRMHHLAWALRMRNMPWTEAFVRCLFAAGVLTLKDVPLTEGQLKAFMQFSKAFNKLALVKQLDLQAFSGLSVATLMLILQESLPDFKKITYTDFYEPAPSLTKSLGAKGQENKIATKVIAVAPNGEIYSISTQQSNTYVMKHDITTEKGTCEDITSSRTAFTHLVFRDNGDLIVASADKSVTVWNLHTGKPIKKIAESGTITALLYMNGILLCATHNNSMTAQSNLIKFWNLNSDDKKPVLTLNTEKASVRALEQWSTNRFVAGTENGLIKELTLSGNCMTTFVASMQAVHLLKKLSGELLASVSDNTIKIWKFHERTLLHTLTGHSGTINTLLPLGNLLVSGASDTKIKIWDIATGEWVCDLNGHSQRVNTLALLNSRIISGSDDGTMTLWAFETKQLIFSSLKLAKTFQIEAALGQIKLSYTLDDRTTNDKFVMICQDLIKIGTGVNSVKLDSTSQSGLLIFSAHNQDSYDKTLQLLKAVQQWLKKDAKVVQDNSASRVEPMQDEALSRSAGRPQPILPHAGAVAAIPKNLVSQPISKQPVAPTFASSPPARAALGWAQPAVLPRTAIDSTAPSFLRSSADAVRTPVQRVPRNFLNTRSDYRPSSPLADAHKSNEQSEKTDSASVVTKTASTSKDQRGFFGSRAQVRTPEDGSPPENAASSSAQVIMPAP